MKLNDSCCNLLGVVLVAIWGTMEEHKVTRGSVNLNILFSQGGVPFEGFTLNRKARIQFNWTETFVKPFWNLISGENLIRYIFNSSKIYISAFVASVVIQSHETVAILIQLRSTRTFYEYFCYSAEMKNENESQLWLLNRCWTHRLEQNYENTLLPFLLKLMFVGENNIDQIWVDSSMKKNENVKWRSPFLAYAVWYSVSSLGERKLG